MPPFFSRFNRIGRLPERMRVQFAPEGILHVAERVHVTQRFSGSAPGVHSALSVNRHIGLVLFTRERLYALLPTIPRLKGPAIDRRWNDPNDGPAKVAVSDDALADLPSRSLAFGVSPDYVFHMLGVRVRT